MVDGYLNGIDNFNQLPQKEQVRLLSYFYCIEKSRQVFSPVDIKSYFLQKGFRAPANIHAVFSELSGENIKRNKRTKQKSDGLVKKSPGAYSLSRETKNEFTSKYPESKHLKEVNNSLLALMQSVESNQQRDFLKEAISCFEIRAYRASIVLTWLFTMDTLYDHVLHHKQKEMNRAQKILSKKKPIVDKGSFEEYKEADILEAMKSVNIITKEQYKLLVEKLNTRNSAAHPNQTTFKEHKVVAYIQELIDDIVVHYV